MGLQASNLFLGRCTVDTYTGKNSQNRLGTFSCCCSQKQAINDYKFAQQYVPTEASKPGRITKGAVQTLLAEMYLTVGKPDSALYWCDQAINNPAYKLITARYGVNKTVASGSAFGDMFKEGNQNREQGNTEALWVFQFE